MFFGFWVPCEILRVTNIELASFSPSSLAILRYFPDLISSSGHPICAESVPSGKRQAV
jgi:hypothetical protein